MAYDAEGTIYIDLVDFYEWLKKYSPHGFDEMRFGVPVFDEASGEMRVSFAACNTECPPEQWMEKPKALKEWENLKKRQEAK